MAWTQYTALPDEMQKTIDKTPDASLLDVRLLCPFDVSATPTIRLYEQHQSDHAAPMKADRSACVRPP
jgi:hypothetical protein